MSPSWGNVSRVPVGKLAVVQEQFHWGQVENLSFRSYHCWRGGKTHLLQLKKKKKKIPQVGCKWQQQGQALRPQEAESRPAGQSPPAQGRGPAPRVRARRSCVTFSLWKCKSERAPSYLSNWKETITFKCCRPKRQERKNSYIIFIASFLLWPWGLWPLFQTTGCSFK